MNLGMKSVDATVMAAQRMRLILLPGLCLLFAGASFAQTNVDPSHVMSPSQLRHAAFSSEGSMPGEKNALPKPAPKPASSTTPAKGTHEGIQVHGYWTIEVRNPDGKVTAHREFENALQAAGESFLGGASAGQSSIGGLAIVLNGGPFLDFVRPNITQGPFGRGETQALFAVFSEAGPCGPQTYTYFTGDTLESIQTQQSGNPQSSCVISTGTTSGGTTESLPASWCNGPGANPGCSTNLVVSGVGTPGSPLSLTGTMTVPSSASAGDINDVETIGTECDSNTTPFNCANYWTTNGAGNRGWPAANTNIAQVGVFTQKTLDSLNGDPAPVPYQPGQTIAVTVQISFQ